MVKAPLLVAVMPAGLVTVTSAGPVRVPAGRVMLVAGRLVAPTSPELGLVELTVSVGALTVKIPLPVLTPASGLVTVTSLAPSGAPAAIVMFAVRWLEST